MRRSLVRVFTTATWAMAAWFVLAPAPLPAQSPGRFEVRFPASLEAKPVTGRVFVSLYPRNDAEPRIAAYQSARTRVGRIPFFAADVNQLAPGAWASIDQDAIGYPYWNIKEIPPGDYYVQAVFNVYTKYERTDGHTIWAHQDQWEGQRWAFAPGNLVSTPVKVHVDPARGIKVQLTFDHKIPPIDVAPDTRWVKRIKIQSPMLTKWWGHPQFLGATILLPKGYDENPNTRYPVVFAQDHFTLVAPFNFATEDTAATPPLNLAVPGTWTAADIDRPTGGGGKRETGYEFFQQWIRDDMPRMIVVKFQHPTPFFDDSYAVNSVNNGPYGDAILQELIPELEKRFRMIAKPYARVLTGGSTGGWESLALQVYHPEYFGGTWTMYPDPVDFRRYQLVDIYRDTSAFLVPNAAPGAPERMMQMSSEGQPVATMRQISQMELASGTRGRSAAQIDIWNATYGPVGADGYPRQLWDLRTGIIDRDVAHYMRDKGFDLRDYLETNWSRIGPQLVGKLHVLTGDMDDFYLGPAVYKLEDFLESTRSPYYGGSFRYGRPNKGHGWQPMTNADLLREMAAQIARNAPAGEPVESWRAAR
ncbi:MAG: alpha/beta hydrolase-fold protein [Gemmatimonadaceae bacterium]